MNRIFRHCVLAAAALALLGGAAQAALVKTSFQGVVTANNPLANSPAIGSAISGDYTIDPTMLLGEGSNCAGVPLCWSGPETSWRWNTSLVTAATTSIAGFYGIRYDKLDNIPGAGPDRLIVNLGGLSFLTTVKLTLTDPTGSAFESGSTDSFTTREFSFAPLCVTGIGCAFNPSYSGVLTSLVAAPVPEPEIASMLLLGALGLSLFARRRHPTGDIPN